MSKLLYNHIVPLSFARGIVQLTNSDTPIVTFRLFAFVIGVSQKIKSAAEKNAALKNYYYIRK